MKLSVMSLLGLVMCLALLSQEAAAWRPWGPRRSFGPLQPVDSDYAAKCAAATDYTAKVKPCRDEIAAAFHEANGTVAGHFSLGPACCALKLGEFDACIRPCLPAQLRNGTTYPPYLQHLCKP